MQPLLSTKPFFSCMGNHEEESEFRYGELQHRLVPWLPQHGPAVSSFSMQAWRSAQIWLRIWSMQSHVTWPLHRRCTCGGSNLPHGCA